MKGAGTLLVALFLGIAFAPHSGATVYHSNGSAANVQALHNYAQDGDTITLPAGTFSWTTQVTITKGITIRGETTTDSDNGTANDQTVLVDNLVRVAGGQGFFHCTIDAGKSFRITGITFSGVNGLTTTMNNGAIRLFGTSDQVRIDHCHFTFLRHHPHIRVNQTIYGVSDHLVVDNAPGQTQGWHIHNGTGNGDLEFSQSAGYGGPKFWFIEDCHIRNTNGVNSAGGGIDGHTAAKYVVRHSHLFNFINLFHGTESSRFRGGRAMEMYNNDFHWTYTTTMDGIRSGSLIAHDNTFYGVKPHGWSFGTYRSFVSFSSVWLGASGDNAWDYNVTEANGTHVDGHPPYLFASGTVSSGSENLASGKQYLTDTTKSWTTNQWVGYTAKRVSDNWLGKILSNDATTLTMYYYEANGVQQARWRAGDQYQIRKVLAALDQPCRGRGGLITGDPPINSITGRPFWPYQEIEPCYSWNNVHSPGGEHISFRPAINPPLRQGRDYFNDTPMPGYTPYTYPHPLVSGGSPSDFNDDGKPDFLLNNPITHQTSVWYLDNNVRIGNAYGPTLWPGWNVADVADFNLDGHPDYLLFRADTGQTAMWYLNNSVRIGSAWGPTVWPGWNVAGVADFNVDGHPDYLLFRADTGQTAMWYLSNNARIGHSFGPTLWPGWNVAGVADFNLDGHPDYLLFRPDTGQTAIWYLNNSVRIGHSFGPTLWPGWNVAGVADLNVDGHPDYLLFGPSTGQTAIWYLDNNVRIGSAWGPIPWAGWHLVAP